jgi:hypothetical protein
VTDIPAPPPFVDPTGALDPTGVSDRINLQAWLDGLDIPGGDTGVWSGGVYWVDMTLVAQNNTTLRGVAIINRVWPQDDNWSRWSGDSSFGGTGDEPCRPRSTPADVLRTSQCSGQGITWSAE